MKNMKRTHITFIMAFIYLILGLIIQASFSYADFDIEDYDESREILNKLDIDDEAIRDFHEAKMDWIDMFVVPNNIFPTSSASGMAQVTNSNKTAEEQLKDIKEMAQTITLAIQSEMANLLSYAVKICDNEENNQRKRRSAETPMDSTQLIMRLLKHIKSNNEYQNIAIENMMSAQEIADKFGIEFNPDPQVLSDLAVAANEQTKELSSILEEACTMKNTTQETLDFISFGNEKPIENASDRNTYFVYSTENATPQEYMPQHVSNVNSEMNHVHYAEPYPNHYHNYPYETQLPSPPVHHSSPPMTPRPNFYDSVSFTPGQDYYPPYCSMEPFSSTTIPVPFEEFEPEPELMSEEFEETISSKIIVERGDEPGSATVNHVTTYTLSEKSNFRTPEIERLPQQMQYSFYLL